MSTFHNRLKELRISKNATQKQVADAIGVKEQTYQKYEYGQNEPNIDTLNKLASYFKTSVDYLVGYEPSDFI